MWNLQASPLHSRYARWPLEQRRLFCLQGISALQLASPGLLSFLAVAGAARHDLGLDLGIPWPFLKGFVGRWG